MDRFDCQFIMGVATYTLRETVLMHTMYTADAHGTSLDNHVVELVRQHGLPALTDAVTKVGGCG
eukprot:SAG11_NODE_1646_length_4523_cov_1.447559_3_plen_64_part_00